MHPGSPLAILLAGLNHLTTFMDSSESSGADLNQPSSLTDIRRKEHFCKKKQKKKQTTQTKTLIKIPDVLKQSFFVRLKA